MLREAFGDHAATPEVIAGVYGEAYQGEVELLESYKAHGPAVEQSVRGASTCATG
ncbi:hypothetical protein RJJ92_13915 [Rhizobium redzepovicii]|nr:hypothetical protein [Rhizobium redzepovicii]MDR9781728.1 hypothetical protein [Rhizobium redzepovicii]